MGLCMLKRERGRVDAMLLAVAFRGRKRYIIKILRVLPSKRKTLPVSTARLGVDTFWGVRV